MRKRFVPLTILVVLLLGASFLPADLIEKGRVTSVLAQAPQHDFGDAPTTYPVLLSDNGARHIHTTPADEWLGNAPSSTSPVCIDGTTNEADALVVDGDTDDGLAAWWFNPVTGTLFATVLVSTPPATPPPYFLNALVDLNQDGDWEDPGEWAVENLVLTLPPSTCNFPVTLTLGIIPSVGDPTGFSTWVRFTITRTPVPGTEEAPWTGTGLFISGETEDYLLTWGPDPPPSQILMFRLTCTPKNRTIFHGGEQKFKLFTTGNIKPNNLKVQSGKCTGCDANATWNPAKGFSLGTLPGVDVLGLLPANTPILTSNDVHACFLGSRCFSKISTWYLNLDPAAGPVGGAYSADTCQCAVKHPLAQALLPGGLKGKVKGPDGLPIPGGKIEVFDPQGIRVAAGQTNELGKYKIKNLPPGDYTVESFFDVLADLREVKPVRIESSMMSTVNFVLRSPGRITGTVGPQLEGSFFDVEIVQLELVGGPKPVFAERTDQNGKYDSERTLAPGNYKVKASSPGYFPEEMNVQIRGGDSFEVNFSLRQRPADFYVSCTPSVLRLRAGASGNSRVEAIAINGFNGFVSSFQATGLPPGVTHRFSPDFSGGPNVLSRSTLILNVGEGVSPGPYPFKVGATSGQLTRVADLLLMVEPRIPDPDPDFVIEFNPGSMTVLQGQSVQSSGRVTSMDGFAGQVMLGCSGLPSGVQWSLQPHPVTPPPNGSAVTALTLNVDSSVQPGTYPFSVSSTNTDVVRSFPMQLIVSGRPQEQSFIIACDPSSVAAPPGGIAQTSCTVTSTGGFSRLVSLSASGLPEGLDAEFQPGSVTPPPNSQASSVLILRVGPRVRPGSYQGIVQGAAAGGPSLTNAIEVKVQ